MDEGIGGNVRGWGIARFVDPFRKDACHFRAHSAKTGAKRVKRGKNRRRAEVVTDLYLDIFPRTNAGRSFLSNETGLITGFWPVIVSRLK